MYGYIKQVHTYIQYVRAHIYMYAYICNASTVKPVYNNHSMDQVIVVSVDRWSLYRGALVQLKWTMSQTTVVSIDRRSLYASGL